MKTPSKERWEEELREELDLKYELMGVRRQPEGNREQWVESDVVQIKEIIRQNCADLLREIEEGVEGLRLREEIRVTEGRGEGLKDGYNTAVDEVVSLIRSHMKE